jgi:hypothetical protein
MKERNESSTNFKFFCLMNILDFRCSAIEENECITHNFRQGTSYIRSYRRLLNVRYLLVLISKVNTTDMCLARILSYGHNKAYEFALTGDQIGVPQSKLRAPRSHHSVVHAMCWVH